MICQKCHKNMATIRYAEVVDGKVTELHMCPSCYTAMQKKAGGGFELVGKAPSPKGFRTARPSPPASRAGTRKCNSCGILFREVANAGVVGCPACYESFREALDPVLENRQLGLKHHGKAPRIDDKRERLRAELQSKRGLLRTAIEKENYEEAAVLRDQIHALEAELDTSTAEQV